MDERRRILIVLHGDRANVEDLPFWATGADVIIAADGGADHCLFANIQPDVVVGDMDGISSPTAAALADKLRRSNDQNTTDFEKALDYASEQFEAADILVFGSEGSRLDHTLAAFGAAAAYPTERTRFVFNDSVAHLFRATVEKPVRAAIPVRKGARVSVIALLPSIIAASEGLKWNLEGLELSPGIRDGISNEAAALDAVIGLESGCILVFVERFPHMRPW